MKMKTVEQSFISFLPLLLTVSCLAIEHQSQIKTPATTTMQEASPMAKADLSNWQTVRLSDKGIKFKLPPDWHHDDSDLTSQNENFTHEAMEWNSPNKEWIRMNTFSYQRGFRSMHKPVASREDMLEETFNLETRIAKSEFLYSEVKRLNVSGVEGIFRRLQINAKDKNPDALRGIFWTGFWIYRGKARKIEIDIIAHAKSEELLPNIFNTIEIEHDKDANEKP